ncbi:sensor histidine kinase [Deinococcus roseus]|uniref:histidine kinase n=1 Tax=Deinococcus roseus TaxID=392414 RepID=A0ABQ2CZJ4_9DEIO|nr:HAMP domain-containing sensor histidine kinase [Deinococcus roseus]GGJ36223.1 two-component sensor histidine kinase [Deinococcus roseus]
MNRKRGLSVRLKLTLSYAGFLMLAGALLLAIVWVFLLRYVPEKTYIQPWQPDLLEKDGRIRPGLPFIPNRSDLARAFLPKAYAVLGFLLFFGVLGGWFLAGRMLAPLTLITQATRRAATGALSHRIRLEGPADEFRELADSFDAMLAQLEAHVAEQQRFAANASHELRTPLAIMQTLLEVARKNPQLDPLDLVERLQTVNARAIRLTEALLLLSRADQRSFHREHVDLSLLAEEANETLLPLAEKRGVTLETSGDMAFTTGSPARLLQLVMNLMHNAIVHNLPEGTVWVTTGVDAAGVRIVVENTGEVLAAERVSMLSEPFLRGNERVASDHAGVGLGLAIAGSITRAHDGKLSLAPRREGGLCVTVQLPASPSHLVT